MKFTTDDHYTITEGKRIYYTGDMANVEGNFIVTKIEPCNFYKFKITLQEEEGGDDRKFILNPTNLDSGIGRRFKPMELVEEERQEAKERFNNFIKASKKSKLELAGDSEAMDEITALEEGKPFFIVKRGAGESRFELFLKCSDSCGNSHSGEFDYHWTYETHEEALRDGQRLTEIDPDER